MWKIILFLVLLVLLLLLNLDVGSSDFRLWAWLNGRVGDRATADLIFWELRLPRTLAAVFAGASLGLSGLLMQTFFRNPIAGPYTLGISSGAGLGVAVLYMAAWPLGAWAQSPWAVALAAAVGSMLVLAALLLAIMRGLNGPSLLILGLMIGSAAGALGSLLEYFSPPQQLQRWVFWSMGNLSGLTWAELWVMMPLQGLAWLLVLLLAKPLNLLLLGERYAQSLGLAGGTLRAGLILLTALLVGSTTAFCGPIAFLGTITPHLAAAIWRTADHRQLLPATLLLGMVLLLLCQWLCLLPSTEKALPLNALTALIGAPAVAWMVLRGGQRGG
jgi:iron complex transport system permease protein